MTIQNYNFNADEKGQTNQAFQSDNPVKQEHVGDKQSPLSTVKVEIPSEAREQWDKPIEFLLSCISLSVGLGNVWRFPFTAYQNGGGAFIIPYLVVLFFIGKPIYFLEMAVGQFSSRGQVKIWKMAPFFKGVGYGSAFGTGCVCSYYCTLMALTVFYFIQSFQATLPWSVCNPEWEFSHNITCNNDNVFGSSKSIPELYFKIDVLKEKNQIDDGIGLPDWRLSLCLLGSWTAVLFSLIKGVKSLGKVAYFTAIFPYVVLFILLIRGVTLEGAMDGIWYFLKPDWNKILEAKVWAAALTQCFYSLGTGFGPIIMFSSYNPFTHNVYKDAMIISIMDTLTSLLAGVTIFSILGNLALELGVDIKEVAGAGSALAFVSYPDAISKFQFVPQLFAVLFFLMLFTLGVGSATSMTNAIITVIHDQFTHVDIRWIATIVCIIGFFSGLIYVTPGGQWMLELVDYFGGGFVIFAMTTMQMVGIVWIYGLSNVVRDIEFMLKRELSFFWKFCWALIPVILLAVLSYTLASSGSLTYEGHPYPKAAIVCGWMIATVALLLIPVAAMHSVWSRKSTSFMEKIRESFRPTSDWGPKDEKIRGSWLALPHRPKTLMSLKETGMKILVLLKLKKEQ